MLSITIGACTSGGPVNMVEGCLAVHVAQHLGRYLTSQSAGCSDYGAKPPMRRQCAVVGLMRILGNLRR